MTSLLTSLPDFDIRPYAHILPSLEKSLISTSDLLTLDPLDVAKRAQVPAGEVRKLVDAVVEGLRQDFAPGDAGLGGASVDGEGGGDERSWTISTLDETLDAALNGGIHSGCLTEITGESAAGKTQFLLTLLLSVQLLSSTPESPKSALYISTEAPLQTTRLTQILTSHPYIAALSLNARPSLARIQSTHIHDLEAQEHILHYQVPVLIARHNVGLVIVDSIAANYRAEFDKGTKSSGGKPSHSLAKRSAQIAQLGTLLRDTARKHNIAVVVANQVADRFEPAAAQIVPVSQQTSTQRSRPASPPLAEISATALSSSAAPPPSPPPVALLSTEDPLALDHQQRFFTGWGDSPIASSNMKTPSLGLTWSNQLATRIALLREPVYEERPYTPGEDRAISSWNRRMKIVFSAWAQAGETGYEIWSGGIRCVQPKSESDSEQ